MSNANKTHTEVKEGIIVKSNDEAGVAYVLDEELQRQFVFGYDKINGYAGQTAKEINLDNGRHVQFILADEIIQSVEL